jgi:hypothetical protein
MMTTRKIEWANSKGQVVVATIEIVTSRELSADGDKVTVRCCDWQERLEIDGCTAGYTISRIPAVQVGAIRVAGRCGAVGIPAEMMDAIDAARSELRASPEWTKHLAELAEADRVREEYEQHSRRVDRMMTGGGRTY